VRINPVIGAPFGQSPAAVSCPQGIRFSHFGASIGASSLAPLPYQMIPRQHLLKDGRVNLLCFGKLFFGVRCLSHLTRSIISSKPLLPFSLLHSVIKIKFACSKLKALYYINILVCQVFGYKFTEDPSELTGVIDGAY
jgi:hypothetical protein